jgi:hypothetical protein
MVKDFVQALDNDLLVSVEWPARKTRNRAIEVVSGTGDLDLLGQRLSVRKQPQSEADGRDNPQRKR